MTLGETQRQTGLLFQLSSSIKMDLGQDTLRQVFEEMGVDPKDRPVIHQSTAGVSFTTSPGAAELQQLL